MVKAALGWVVMVLLLASGVARAQEAVGLEEPPASSVDESQTSIDGTFREPRERVRLTDLLKDYLKDQAPFLRDAKLTANARTYWLLRDQLTDATQQGWAGGGWLAFKSGYLWDRFAVGTTAYTSQPLYGPDDEPGTLLLENNSDQDSYSVFGELYAEIKLGEEMVVDLGRKELNTPYINRNDNRMTPNTFEAYTLIGNRQFKSSEADLKYGAGWVTRIKERNSDRFKTMSEDAGADVDRGVAVAAFNYKTKNASFGIAEYYSSDVINIAYAEAKYSRTLDSGLGLLGAMQFTDQRSTGSDELTGGDSFAGNQVGVKLEASYGGALVAIGYTKTAGGSNLRNPWSSYPGYTSVQVDDFNREDEEATLTKVTYDLTKLGLTDVSATVLWVHGSGVDRDVGQDEDEYDIDLQWRPKGERFKGFSFRARRAYIRQRGADNDTLDDYRLIVNYDFAVF